MGEKAINSKLKRVRGVFTAAYFCCKSLFSHTTGSQAKPNHATRPLLTQPLLLCYNFANNWLKVNETRRISRYKYITTSKNLNELEKLKRGGGGVDGAGQAMADGNKQNCTS